MIAAVAVVFVLLIGIVAFIMATGTSPRAKQITTVSVLSGELRTPQFAQAPCPNARDTPSLRPGEPAADAVTRLYNAAACSAELGQRQKRSLRILLICAIVSAVCCIGIQYSFRRRKALVVV